jgi:hypothetical protein
MVDETPMPSGVLRAIRRMREGAIIWRGAGAWLINTESGFEQKLHLHTFDSLMQRSLIEAHPTIQLGWRLKKPNAN